MVARAAAKKAAKDQRAAAKAKTEAGKAAKIDEDRARRAAVRKAKQDADEAMLVQNKAKAARAFEISNSYDVQQAHFTLTCEDEDFWNLEDGMACARDQFGDDPEFGNVDSLFTNDGTQDTLNDEVGMRSLSEQTAGPGALDEPEPVRGATAPSPITQPKTAGKAKAKPKLPTEKAEVTLRGEELWRKVRTAVATAALPKESTSSGSCARAEEYRTPQQLNAVKQNRRRAEDKARQTAELRRTAVDAPATSAEAKKKAKGTALNVVEPPRILDTVAEFWARKRAKLEAASSSSAHSS